MEEDTLLNRIKAAYTAGAEPPPPTTQSRNPAPASFASSPPPGAGTPCSPAPFVASSVSIASEDYEAEWEPPVGPMTRLDRLLLAGLLVFVVVMLLFVILF